MILKTALAAEVLVVAAASVAGPNGTAETIILWGAAVTGITVLWRYVIRPLGIMVRHAGRIVKRTAEAVDALETLPRWRSEHDERLSDVEAEVGIVSNDVAAIRRKMGITDAEVRQTAPITRHPHRHPQ